MTAARQRRVLCVDESRQTREALQSALAERVDLECVATLEEGLEALEREAPDVVVSGWFPDERAGATLIENALRVSPEVPFVVMTEDAERAMSASESSAVEVLAKPLREERVVAVIERLLDHRALALEAQRLRGVVGTLESCRVLLQCLEPGEVYAVALDLLLPRLGRDLGLALFRRSSMPGSDGIAFRGFDEEAATQLQRVAQKKSDAELFASREARVTHGGPIAQALEELGIGSGPALVVPLHGAESEEGLLWLPELDRRTTEWDLEQARMIAAYGGIALANAERYHQAKERAFIDDVTSVYNARYLLQATEHEIHRADRSGQSLSVLFLDLDRFKRVNDRFGHLVGSNVLRRLSEVLLDCVRQVDTLARYGGDEFTILLVDTGLEGGVAVAERIRRIVEETVFEAADGTPIRLSISIGVATFPDHGNDREGLLDMADKAMYRAKSRGRNCVCSASDLEV